MATLIKQHGRYYVQFYSAPKSPARKRIPLYTAYKREAVEYKGNLESWFNRGDYCPWSTPDWRVLPVVAIGRAEPLSIDSIKGKASSGPT